MNGVVVCQLNGATGALVNAPLCRVSTSVPCNVTVWLPDEELHVRDQNGRQQRMRVLGVFAHDGDGQSRRFNFFSLS